MSHLTTYSNPYKSKTGLGDDLVTAPAGEETLYDIWEKYSLLRLDELVYFHSPIRFNAQTQAIERLAYEGITYRTMRSNIERFATAFVTKFGLKPGSMVMLWACNSPEWIITEQACNRQSMVLVPIYDSLSTHGMSYCIDATKPDILVVSRDKIGRLVKVLTQTPVDLSFLKAIILTTDLEFERAIPGNQVEELNQLLARSGMANPHLTDLLGYITAAVHVVPPVPPTPNTISSLIYTSGTSSTPKGVIISHGALTSACYGYLLTPLDYVRNGKGVHYLSYLPMAHIYERVIQATGIIIDGKVYFWRGDFKTLLRDMQEVKPDILCGVPKVYTTLYQAIRSKLEASPLTRRWFHYGLKGDSMLQRFAKRCLYGLVRHKIGVNFKLMISGGASLPPKVHLFVQDFFQCNLIQGYGQTETCACVTVQCESDYSVDNCGVVCPNMELRIDPAENEVLLRGSSMFSRYYVPGERFYENVHDFPPSTDWYRSGDCGLMTEDNKLVLKDRINTNFKLQNGEFVCPETIELMYLQSALISAIYIPQTPNSNHLYAFVVPSESLLTKMNVANYFSPDQPLSLTGFHDKLADDMATDSVRTNEQVEALEPFSILEGKHIENHIIGLLKQKIMKDLTKVHSEAGMKPFMYLKDIHLLRHELTIENGYLTATQKLCRKKLYTQLQPEIEAMVDKE
ncbi:Long-chain-fatty-acid--CoA ligase [Giardia duodenalis]|nr:Long chain fatty acid CoA ligase 5 [Giardia intestinalis ATCC 50581]ESU43834.1 Long-chain-fatty-acid--CoA ligase [Giardia intestinalis]